MNLLNVVVWIFICYLSFCSGQTPPVTWLEASKACKNQGEIVSPMIEDNFFSTQYHNNSFWTSNYIFNIGCENLGNQRGSMNIVNLLYVNRIAKTLFNSNCSKDPKNQVQVENVFNGHIYRLCKGGSHIRITDMSVLGSAIALMEIGSNYTVDFFDDVKVFGENIGRCSVVMKFANQTTKLKSGEQCTAKHKYKCADGSRYTTVIRLEQNRCSAGNQILEGEKPSEVKTTVDGIQYFDMMMSGLGTSGLVIIGLVIIAILLKRWISKLQTVLLENLRQKYDHHMYQVEQREMLDGEYEAEPETPISPGGDSLYENVNQLGPRRNQNFKQTVSYASSNDMQRASNEIQRPVTVPLSENEGQIEHSRPRLALPSRFPSRDRGHAVRHKTTITESASFPLTKPVRKSRQRKSSCSSAMSNNFAVYENDSLDLESLTEETVNEAQNEKDKLDIHRPKPFPIPEKSNSKPNSGKSSSHGLTVRDISGEFVFYLNRSGENEGASGTDEDYECIWKQKK